MNVIRIADSTWSTLEPQDGIFDFSYIKQMLELAKAEDMKIIIGTPTYAVPAWLVKKDPDVMVWTKDGRAKYGQRQLFDILNPTFRQHAERVISKLIEYTANHPNVIGFQVDNETKHYGNTSVKVQELFKQYLVDTFETPSKLNDTFKLAYWSNSIHDWDDLPNMEGCVNGGLAGEFEAFRRTLVTDYLNWQVELVNQYKREEQFVTHNFDFEWKKFSVNIAPDGYSYGVQPDVDHHCASQALTIAGADIYHPTQDELTGAEIAFCGDEIRGLKNQNYLVLECQAQAFKYWTPYPGQLRLHAYSHLASGAEGLMYWNWHSIHNGCETYWKGLLSHDLSSNPTYEEAGVVGAEWKRFGQKRLRIHKTNSVALVIDNRSLKALEWFPIDKKLSYNDVVRWMYDSLYEMNIECDVIHAEELNAKDYQVILTPALYCADNELITSLKEFVAAGGTLISSFKSFVANKKATVYHDTQPHGLHECFGMNYNQITDPGQTKINGMQVKYFAELLKPDNATALYKYEHPYWQWYAGITKNQYGKGKAYYIGCHVEKGLLKEVFEDALKGTDIDGEQRITQWPVVVKSGINEVGEKIHYILHYSEEVRQWQCPYERVQNILTGIHYQRGDLVELKDWDVMVLAEE